MISEQGLAALRVAATLTHSLPGLRARIRSGVDVVLDVRHDAEPSFDAEAGARCRTIAPCAFRCAVTRAYQRHLAGEQLRFLHLPAGVDPAIDIGTPSGGRARPGGLYRVPVDARWVWAFASTLPADDAHDLGQDLVDAAQPLPFVSSLGVRPDRGTGVALAFAEVTASPGSAAEDRVVDLLESLMARWTAHELVNAATGASRTAEW